MEYIFYLALGIFAFYRLLNWLRKPLFVPHDLDIRRIDLAEFKSPDDSLDVRTIEGSGKPLITDLPSSQLTRKMER